MTYDEIVLSCKQLEYKDKLRLIQLLSQMVKEEERLNLQGETGDGQPVSLLSENGDKIIRDVAKRLMKLKPNKRSSLSNSIVSMFQFHGGISESDTEMIIAELQRLRYLKIDKNDKVKYLNQQPASQ